MIARFTRGSITFDLTAAPYSLGDDFAPVAAGFEYNLAPGTSANRYAGSARVNEKAVNVDWSFRIRILGGASSTLEYIDAAVRRIVNFIKLEYPAPLFFEFSGSNMPEPLWGQLGAPLRYEIATADAELVGQIYQDRILREYAAYVQLKLTVKPLAYGREQDCALAAGGIVEDTLGAPAGTTWGTRLLGTTTNKMTDPAFSYDTTASSWTFGSNIINSIVRDEGFLILGQHRAVELISKGSTNNTATQSINVGNANKHSLSAVVCKRDGTAVTSSDAQIYYGSAQSTSVESLGSGFYRIYTDNINGVNALTATGVLIPINRTVILCHFQIEEKTSHTYPCHGDMLGCTWTGTAYASTSSRNSSQAKVGIARQLGGFDFTIASGAVYIVWQPDYASASCPDTYFFCTDTRAIFAWFSGGVFMLQDASHTATYTQSFSKGDTIHLCFTWGPTSGLNLYYAGVSRNTALYTLASGQSYVFIGSDQAAGNQSGRIVKVATYDYELSASDVATIYAKNSNTGGAQVNPAFPWDWTKDGDGVIDNCNDSTRDNWKVFGGVGGTAPAMLEYIGTHVNESASMMCITGAPDFYNPGQLYAEHGGTADATCSGGEYLSITIDTTADTVGTVDLQNCPRVFREMMAGRGVYAFLRFAESSLSTTMSARIYANIWGTAFTTPWQTITTDTAARGFLIGPVRLPELTGIFDRSFAFSNPLTIYCELKRGSSSSAIKLDFVDYLPGDLIYLPSTTGFWHREGETGSYTGSPVEGRGVPLYAMPMCYNPLVAFAVTNGAAHTITRTFTYYASLITPRYHL